MRTIEALIISALAGYGFARLLADLDRLIARRRWSRGYAYTTTDSTPAGTTDA